MPILALGKALQRRNHLATLDQLVEQYDKVRACQLEDSYDIALRQLRSIFFHNWHILFVRRDFLPGSSKKEGAGYRTLFTREQVLDKLVSLMQVYSAILVAQEDSVGDFEEFETKLFELIEGVHNAGAKHVHHVVCERPSEWASTAEFGSYVEHAEVLRNPRKGKIGIHEHDPIEGAVALLFEPEFTVIIPEEELEDGMENGVPLKNVLDSAADLLEDEEAAEKEDKKKAAAEAASAEADGKVDLDGDSPTTSAFATSSLKLTLRPHANAKAPPPVLDLSLPVRTIEPALPPPQHRKPIPKIRLFRARSDTPAQSFTPPAELKRTFSETSEMEREMEMENPPAHSLRKSTRVKRETEIVIGWELTGK